MRIVSLLPSATEILFAIGAGDEVVGVTHECDFPPQARSLPRLTSSALPAVRHAAAIDRHVRRRLHEGSSLYRLDAELLARLRPDLIVTQELCEVCAVSYGIVDRAVRRLRTDPRVVSLEPSSLDDVLATVLFLGTVTRHEDAAKRLTAKLRAKAANLSRRSRRPNAHAVRVLLLEWTDPPMSAGHWTPELIELAGATPVLAHPRAGSQRLEWEAIAAADPDAIVVAPCGLDENSARAAVSDLEAVPQWLALRAYREGAVHVMDGNAYVSRPGPRLIESAAVIARLIGTLPT
ncbi:MAG: ABC transporter substrate-binding protein [Candidatus Eremiobacteraeota bacterium]|nr:ABC transporter substrate-binding protein [Candidatus Eremiobacteraeota bacterium]